MNDDNFPIFYRGCCFSFLFGGLIWLGLLLVAYAIGTALGLV